MNEGKIVLVNMQISTGGFKKRPALILRRMPNNDYLICGISSQTDKEIVEFDILIDPIEEVFKNSGLLQKSIIRLSYLATVSPSIIQGTIGSISNEDYNILISRLVNHLEKKK